MIACLIFVVINKVADGNDDLSMASDRRRGVLYLYSIVPIHDDGFSVKYQSIKQFRAFYFYSS